MSGASEVNRRRREFTVSLALAVVSASARAAAGATTVEVWTGPSCGCCKDWVKHLLVNGFRAQTHDGGNSEARGRLGMPIRFGACHTAEVGGYALEGHVPAREIHRLLKDRPTAVGLAVPAMPRGSPGMDGPEYGGARDPHHVYLGQRDARRPLFQSFP